MALDRTVCVARKNKTEKQLNNVQCCRLGRLLLKVWNYIYWAHLLSSFIRVFQYVHSTSTGAKTTNNVLWFSFMILCKDKHLNMWPKTRGDLTCCVNHCIDSQWEAKGGPRAAFPAESLPLYEACFSLTVSGIKRANPRGLQMKVPKK